MRRKSAPRPASDRVDVPRRRRVNIKHRTKSERLRALRQFDELGDVRKPGMTSRPATGPVGVALRDDFGRGVAPKLGYTSNPRHLNVLFKQSERLEPKPCVDDKGRAFRQILDDREDRLVARFPEEPIASSIDVFEDFEKRRLHRIEPEQGPASLS